MLRIFLNSPNGKTHPKLKTLIRDNHLNSLEQELLDKLSKSKWVKYSLLHTTKQINFNRKGKHTTDDIFIWLETEDCAKCIKKKTHDCMKECLKHDEQKIKNTFNKYRLEKQNQAL